MNYTLKRDGWHFRLQRWTFGDDLPRFNNFCPFFWLTIFCMMVSPLTLVLRLLFRALLLLLDLTDHVVQPIARLLDRIAVKRKVKYEHKIVTFVDKVTDQQAYQLFRFIYGWRYDYEQTNLTSLYTTYKFDDMRYNKKKLYRGRFSAWKEKYNDWQKRILTFKALEDKKYIEAEEKRKTKKASRRASLVNIAERTKILVWLPLGIIANYLVYWSALLVLVCVENPMGFLMVFLGAVSVLICIAAVAAITLLAVDRGWDESDVARPFKAVGRVIAKPFGFVFNPIGRGIKEVCGFLWMSVVAFKENYCPQIDWKD